MNAYLRIDSYTFTENLIADYILQDSATANIRFSKKTGVKMFINLKMNLLKKKNNKKQSGAVFDFILLASFTDFREGEIPITFILFAAIFIRQQVYEGIAVQDNISNMAHIVGGIVGAIIGYVLNVKSKYGFNKQ